MHAHATKRKRAATMDGPLDSTRSPYFFGATKLLYFFAGS
jgi:hypothetical protein